MRIKTVAEQFERIEKTSSRNDMVELLAELFSQAGIQEIGKLAYIVQGKLGPLFSSIEFGIAEKMMIHAVTQAFDAEESKVRQRFDDKGDLGSVAEELSKEYKNNNKTLTVKEVYDALHAIAKTSGSGSQEEKLTGLATLFRRLDSLSVRYIVRIPVGKLRLGFSDMTILDGLSWMLSGSKKHRKEIEQAYNVRPDLGFIADVVKKDGIAGLLDIAPVIGTPIRMAKAERMSSGEEIINKIGTCAVEPKIDGFRLQCHLNKVQDSVELFSRSLENVTRMYPDVVEGIRTQASAKNAILEGEAVAYNIQTGEYLPFQETVQRKRKYNIKKKAEEIPLKLICFDLLYLNGRNLLHESYNIRREKLEKVIKKGGILMIADGEVVDNPKRLQQIFEDALSQGLEGVMAKRLKATYQAGARNWNWIKYKRSYAGRLMDTIDAVVMGYDYGRGKRTGFGIGAFLIGIYDDEMDIYRTIAKVGTGLTDVEWRRMKKLCEPVKTKRKPACYDVDITNNCDIWVKPKIVVEILADEITRSAIHTAGRKMCLSKSGRAKKVETPGYALRFPRLERFRDDKRYEDTTSLKEIEEMFQQQRQRK